MGIFSLPVGLFGNHPPPEPEVEKGALDSLSLKGDEENSSSSPLISEHSSPLITVDSSPLITMEKGSSVPVKKSNGVVEGGSFDQVWINGVPMVFIIHV